ncbi:MAG: CvpA family protein [Candidatus Omnitrophica bacterium]|jgi:uncharacterized membrane protein required for colicin V production|nr:CvpA family protein [Candidatus Omnitrophota bacterium]
MGILSKVHLIDIIFLIIYLRIIYIALSRKVLSESFKLIGILVGIIFAFQYYSFGGEKIAKSLPFISSENIYSISFLAILLATGVVFVFLRMLIISIFKITRLVFKGNKSEDNVSPAESWLAFFIGIARATLVSSTLIFMICLAPFDTKNISQALSYKILKNISPKTYLILANIYNKIALTKLEINNDVVDYCQSP